MGYRFDRTFHIVKLKSIHLVTGDYASKLVEAAAFPTNDAKVVIKFLNMNILISFVTPRAIISDDGSHLCNQAFETLFAKFGVKHKIAIDFSK